MECQICTSKLFARGETVFSTICGHLYHEKCIGDWIRTKENGVTCPSCRKPIDRTKMHPIFVDDNAVTDPLLAAQVSSLSDLMKTRDKKTEDAMEKMMKTLEKMNVTLSKLDKQDRSLERENEEMKEQLEQYRNMVDDMGRATTSGCSKEMAKAKDIQINALIKENSELRAQRAENTREMNAIRDQITQLKNSSLGEAQRQREVNEPRQQNLTLKFDNVNDKLIIE